jgi:hypothetical protein
MKLLVSIFAGVSIILTLVCLSLVYKNSTLEKGIRTRISRKYKNGPGSKNSDPMDFFSDMDLGDEDEDTNSALTSGDEDEAPNWITNELSPPGSSKTVSGRGSANSKDENTWEVTVHGASGATVYLSTIIFRINKASPRVGGKVHFDGMARLASGQQVNLHLSSPSGDPFWYITLGDTIHRSADGSNLTPVIGYTKCSSSIKPWEIGSMCQWTLHEGKDVGWQVKPKIKLSFRSKPGGGR